MALGYVLPIVIPTSGLLLVVGGLGVLRPWTAKRPILRVIWFGGVLILAVSAFTVPWLITSPPDDFAIGSASVDGLPGQGTIWYGTVACTGSVATGLALVAKVDARNSNGVEDYEVRARIVGDDAVMSIWADDVEAALPVGTLELDADENSGTIVSEAVSTPRLAHPVIVTLSWTWCLKV